MSTTEHLMNKRLQVADDVDFLHAVKTCFLVCKTEIKEILATHNRCEQYE
jgi:hypothetical protein